MQVCVTITFKNNNISKSDFLLEPGGLTDMIELVFLVEKELRLGHMNKIKTKLLKLSKNRKISKFLDLFLYLDTSEIFVIASFVLKENGEQRWHFSNGSLSEFYCINFEFHSSLKFSSSKQP